MSYIFPGLPDDYVKNRHIGPGAVDTTELADDAVENAKIGPLAVDTTELAAGAVTDIKVNDVAIGKVTGTITPSNNTVGTGPLKTSSGSVSVTNQPYGINQTLPGGAYGFYPQIKMNSAAYANIHQMCRDTNGITGTSYATRSCLGIQASTGIAYAQQYYVTASGEVHWIFKLIDKATGEEISAWQAPDHVSFGNRSLEQPWPDFDDTKHEIIVVNPSLADVEKIVFGQIPAIGGGYMTKGKSQANVEEDFSRDVRDFLEVFDEMFDIDTGREDVFPDIPVTVGLGRSVGGHLTDYRFKPEGTVIPVVKQVIKKPDFVTCLKYKPKGA